MDTSHPCVWTQREAKLSGEKPELVEKDLVRINSNFRETDQKLEAGCKCEAKLGTGCDFMTRSERICLSFCCICRAGAFSGAFSGSRRTAPLRLQDDAAIRESALPWGD